MVSNEFFATSSRSRIYPQGRGKICGEGMLACLVGCRDGVLRDKVGGSGFREAALHCIPRVGTKSGRIKGCVGAIGLLHCYLPWVPYVT